MNLEQHYVLMQEMTVFVSQMSKRKQALLCHDEKTHFF